MIEWQQIYYMSVLGHIGRGLSIISIISLLFWAIFFIVAQNIKVRIQDRTIYKFFIASLIGFFLGMAIPNEQEIAAMVIVPTAVRGKENQDLSFHTLNELQKRTNLWFNHVRTFYIRSNPKKKECTDAE